MPRLSKIVFPLVMERSVGGEVAPIHLIMIHGKIYLDW